MLSKEEIGEKISSARKRKNLRQEDLAKLLNVSDKAISNWETGKNYPDLSYFNDLERILDINLLFSKKKKSYIEYLILSLFFLLIIAFIITVLNLPKTYNLDTDSKNIIIENAYVYTTYNSTTISINYINDLNNNDNPYKFIELYYYDGNKKEIITTEIAYHGINVHLDKRLSKKELENLYLDYYSPSNMENKQDNIHLVLSKEKKIKSQSENENLLSNNGYKKVAPNIYQKKVDNTIYNYNRLKQEIYIEKSEIKNDSINRYYIVYSENNNDYSYIVLDSYYNVLNVDKEKISAIALKLIDVGKVK